jgi:hypothetical protein
MLPRQVELLPSSWSLDQQLRQTEAYDLLARIENKIRRFIYYSLQQSYGNSWWIAGVPTSIQRYVAGRIRRMPLQRSSADPTELIDFGDYKSIIAPDANCSNVFSKILQSKNEIIEHLARVN